MGLMRSALLAGSQSAWLRERATTYPFVRRSVSRFMPGERLEDALRAAGQLRDEHIPSIFTRLGENITALREADEVTAHYVEAMQAIRLAGLDTQVSVKLTQLGLDQGLDACLANALRLVEAAEQAGNVVWIDMESSAYVDPTLAVYRRLRARSRRVGVCVQAYLRRTAADVESLIPLGAWIRLVKGAYRESPAVAFPDARDVDERFFALAERMLRADARAAGTRVGIATHDPRLVRRLQDLVRRDEIPPGHYEFEMLYGIQRPLQQAVVRERWPLRVLVAYGDYWFPWYMRRLAERPANVLFVLRNLVQR
jgi:proline dehydrogenase